MCPKEMVSEIDICNWSYEGRFGVIQAAVEADQSLVSKTDSSKRSGLHWACSSGKTDVVNYFIAKGAQVNTKNS